MDVAQAGDEILIAGGIYTGVNHALGLAQMAVIAKSVTLRGGYAIDHWEHSLPITRPTILDVQNAGRVFYISGLVSPVIENVSLVNGNSAGLGGRWGISPAGGGMYVISATVLLSNTIFEGNQSNVGGGIYAENSHFSLLNSVIVSNTAHAVSYTESLGGGLFFEGGNSYLVNNRIEFNRADYGGGLSVYDGRAELSHNRIQDNFSSLHGGGVLCEGTNGLLINNVITGNSGGPGGGIALSGNILVFNNTISQNTGNFGGGAVLFDGNITLVGNTISDNQSNGIGGGVVIDYTGSPGPNQKILAGNLISGNIATNGGGLFLQFVHPSFYHNQIIGNQALQDGGGFYIHNAEASLDGDQILKNIANRNGGGLFIDQGSTLDTSNLILAENAAAGQGSALYIQDTSVNLAQATIANNPGSSGISIRSEVNAIFFHSLVTMTNTIVAGHTTAITASQGSTVTIDGILWFGNQTNIDGLGTYIIKNTVDGVPAFTADYHIGQASAARDTGVPSGILLDTDTEPRPYGKFDLGADEFWPLGILKRFFLPFIYR